MPTIDGQKLVENSARCFRAVSDDGWAVKMKLAKNQGEWVLPVSARERAEEIVDYLNSLKAEKRTSEYVMNCKGERHDLGCVKK